MKMTDLFSCPFCCHRNLTINVCFDGKVARVTCVDCLATGPWVKALDKATLIAQAKSAWNGMQKGVDDGKKTERE